MLVIQLSRAQKLDRSQRPLAGPAPIIRINDPVVYKLANGITLLVVENHSLPKISAGYSIDGGPVYEGTKAGVVGLLSEMLNEGTENNTKAQFDEKVDQIGAEVKVSATGGQVSALTEYFNDAFLLMAEALRKPAFSNESFAKLKSQRLHSLRSNEKSVPAVSNRVVNALSFGTNHPYGEFPTAQSVKEIQIEDIKEIYRKIVSPSRGYLTIIGDITPKAAKALAIKAWGDWQGNTLTFPSYNKAENPIHTEVNLIDMPNAVQSEITVINLIDLPLSSPDYHAVLLANQILGVGASGRLFQNLREKHGFTYGAYSKTGSGRVQSTFSASASVRNDKVDSALVELLREIKQIGKELVTPVELQNAKNLCNGNFAMNLESPAVGAGFASSILINDLPKNFYRTFLEKLNAVTREDVLKASKKYFDAERARVVIVGRAQDILPGLKASGYEIKQFDVYAKPVPAANKI